MTDEIIYARAGAQIKDEAGNLVATLTRDIYYLGVPRADDFVMADGTTPDKGAPIPRAIVKWGGLRD